MLQLSHRRGVIAPLALLTLLATTLCPAAANRRLRDVTAWESPLATVNEDWRTPVKIVVAANSTRASAPASWGKSSVTATLTALAYFWVCSIVFAAAYGYRMVQRGENNRGSLLLDEDDGIHYRQWVDAL